MARHEHRAKQSLKPKLFFWGREDTFAWSGALRTLYGPHRERHAVTLSIWEPGWCDEPLPPARRVLLGLDTVALRIGLITHLHSDHTLGLPDVERIERKSLAIGVAGFKSSLGADPTGEGRSVARIGNTQLMNAVSKRESGSRNEAMH